MGEIYMALERFPEATQAYTTYLTLRPGVLDSFAQERRGTRTTPQGTLPRPSLHTKPALAAPHIGDDTALQIKIAQAVASSGDTTSALDMYNSIAKGQFRQ